MQHLYMVVVGSGLILVSGCHQAKEPPAKGQGAQAEANARANGTNSSAVTADLTERDAEIIRHVLAEYDDPPGNRIYFLTSTPMNDWGPNGNWSDLPQSFHNSVASLNTKYRRAHEAYLKEDCVLEKGTNAKAWMRWITIKTLSSLSDVPRRA